MNREHTASKESVAPEGLTRSEKEQPSQKLNLIKREGKIHFPERSRTEFQAGVKSKEDSLIGIGTGTESNIREAGPLRKNLRKNQDSQVTEKKKNFAEEKK